MVVFRLCHNVICLQISAALVINDVNCVNEFESFLRYYLTNLGSQEYIYISYIIINICGTKYIQKEVAKKLQTKKEKVRKLIISSDSKCHRWKLTKESLNFKRIWRQNKLSDRSFYCTVRWNTRRSAHI